MRAGLALILVCDACLDMTDCSVLYFAAIFASVHIC